MKGSPIRRIGYYGLAAVEQYRGRRGAGLALLDRLASEVPDVRDDAVYHAIRADYLMGTGDAAAVWAEVERARTVDPRLAAEHAVSLAYLGDLEHAALLARDLSAGTGFGETAAALARIRRGESDAGLEELRRISSTTPVFTWRVSPLYLYGEELAQAGRDAQAVEVLHRAQSLYVPVAMWRSWAYPRSLYLVARSCHRLGRTAEARQSLDRLFSDWSEPEPDAPLLREARALRAQLPAR